MFRKQLVRWIVLWLILVLGCFWLLYSPSGAKAAYQRLINDQDRIKKERQKEKTHPSQQSRTQVSKQILYKKEGHRMQSRLASESSDLIYSKEKGDLIECFKGLTCMMQDELLNSSHNGGNNASLASSPQSLQQVVRQFKAQRGTYIYKSGQLKAEEVEIAHYLLPGSLWPNDFDRVSPLLKGRARAIDLSIFEGLQFKAQGFEAIFYDWGEE